MSLIKNKSIQLVGTSGILPLTLTVPNFIKDIIKQIFNCQNGNYDKAVFAMLLHIASNIRQAKKLVFTQFP